jgi:phosphoribosylamine--glycine ligase
MKVLVVGSGGREHALVWKLAQDRSRPDLFCAPGNAGTAGLAVNLDIGAEDLRGLLEWARRNKPDLTVVGPEVPLCEGLQDLFAAEGFRVFGPSRAAARMEGSKVFSKEVMQAAGVPTAGHRTFTQADEALQFLKSRPVPVVVKAEGLAAGKGVYVCRKLSEAELAVTEIMHQKVFGAAGSRVVIEDCLEGEEASILALVDGKNVVMLAAAQDHKRVRDQDQGPNTGGMGAYSPAPVVKESLWPVIRAEVFERTLAELRRRGIVYQGVLYAGLMMTPSGPRVLEFNCRFGDPETQVVIPRLAGDLLPILNACVDGCLQPEMVTWKPDACVCVVMASGGYPGSYSKGKVISGLEVAGGRKDTVVFHAGTALQGRSVVTAGGRVLGVTATGATLQMAVDRAYEAVRAIHFEGAHYRTDIAARAL